MFHQFFDLTDPREDWDTLSRQYNSDSQAIWDVLLEEHTKTLKWNRKKLSSNLC